MFCKICGNELNENAVVCVKCGCAVEQEKKVEKVAEKSVSVGGTTTAYKVLDFVTKVLVVLAVTLFMASRITYQWENYLSYLVVCFIFATMAYGTGLATFIIGFKKENKNRIFSSVLTFILVSAVLAISIPAFVDVI